MSIRITRPLMAAALFGLAGGSVLTLASGSALAAKSGIQQECSTKYQAAKAANTLNGQTYKDFYKQCRDEAKAGAATPAAAPAAAPTAAPAPAPAVAPAPAPAAAPATRASKAAPEPAAPTNVQLPAPAPAAAGSPVFPSAISPSVANLTAGKQRFQTCLAQYHANKATGGNAGLTWIGKGQYYSLCNTRLKGGA